MIKLSSFIVWVLLFFSPSFPRQLAFCQDQVFEKNISDRPLHERFQNRPSSNSSNWLDVSYYRLELSISAAPPHIAGRTTVKGISGISDPSNLILDLNEAMHVDSVKAGVEDCRFQQEAGWFSIRLPLGIAAGDQLTLDIYYQGIPSSSGFGSFEFGAHSGIPWIWSLSEPYGARDWFPCKDHPSDKADSSDVIVRCDSSFSVGSNGRLVSVANNSDGTKTHHWKEKYPIASYLISIAITNYEKFSNWFKYSPVDSMEILNYVLPENLSSASASLPMAVGMMEIFSRLFGIYPFIEEKYGHADFGRGGAMEHQTMTSTTTYSENTIAHELAHQWFGDMITCRTWQDLWLNEGFAQYATGLYLENKYGASSYKYYMRNQLGDALNAKGSLFVEDTTLISNLFDHSRVYAKGASVLHMLRHIMGDSSFFKALRNYADDPKLKYSVASTSDFRQKCEDAAGTDLDYFFNEWVFGAGYPVYSVTWNDTPTGMGETEIILKQHDRGSNSFVFSMPVDLRLSGDLKDTMIRVWNNSKEQVYISRPGFAVKKIEVDPDEWILKIIAEDFPESVTLHQNYPNPCRSYTNIRYDLPSRAKVNISAYSLLGQKVKTLVDETVQMGPHELVWSSLSDLPSGLYFIRLRSLGQTMTNKLIVIR